MNYKLFIDQLKSLKSDIITVMNNTAYVIPYNGYETPRWTRLIDNIKDGIYSVSSIIGLYQISPESLDSYINDSVMDIAYNPYMDVFKNYDIMSYKDFHRETDIIYNDIRNNDIVDQYLYKNKATDGGILYHLYGDKYITLYKGMVNLNKSDSLDLHFIPNGYKDVYDVGIFIVHKPSFDIYYRFVFNNIGIGRSGKHHNKII